MKKDEEFILVPAQMRERVYPALDKKELERRKAAAKKSAVAKNDVVAEMCASVIRVGKI